jgi:hypothetical protein
MQENNSMIDLLIRRLMMIWSIGRLEDKRDMER